MRSKHLIVFLKKLPTLSRRLLPAMVIFFTAACTVTFMSPDQWLLPIRTLQIPAGGETGLRISPYLLEDIDSLTVIAPPALEVVADLDADTLIIRSLTRQAGVHLVKLSAGKRTATIAVRTVSQVQVSFTFRTAPGPLRRVAVAGSFTDWQADRLTMQDMDRDGIYSVTTWLPPQRLEYVLVVDGEWMPDPANENSVSNGAGGFNSVLDLRDQVPPPAGHFVRKGHDGANFSFSYHRPGSAPPVDPGKITLLLDNNRLPVSSWTYDGDSAGLSVRFHIKASGFVRILAMDMEGGISRETQFIIDQGRTVEAGSDLESWYSRTVYYPMTDRFRDGNTANNSFSPDPRVKTPVNYLGGDLEGITLAINEGYFDSLGITALWIGPLNQGPDSAFTEYPEPHDTYTGYHGYWPVSSTVVDRRYGGDSAARELVASAHGNEMKVILDFVANHTHQEHPFFRDHPEWYAPLKLEDGRDNIGLWDERRLDTRFDIFLPSFNYQENDEAIDVMTDNALYWLDKLNLDGLRLDAVKHVPNKFWIILTRKLHGQYPGRHIFQLGESFGSDELIKQYIGSTQMDGQFNFNLYFGTRESFALGSGSMTDVVAAVEYNLRTYDPLNFMGTLVSSHDQTRFIAFADKAVGFSENAKEVGWNRPPPAAGRVAHERLRLYYNFILTLPGVPIFYYGDEIGLSGAGDPDNRRPMKWDNWTALESETFGEISKLLHLRKDHPALAVGDFVRESATEHILVYRRVGFNEQLLVLLNKGDGQAEVRLPPGNTQWLALYGQEGTFAAGSELMLKARSGAVLLAR